MSIQTHKKKSSLLKRRLVKEKYNENWMDMIMNDLKMDDLQLQKELQSLEKELTDKDKTIAELYEFLSVFTYQNQELTLKVKEIEAIFADCCKKSIPEQQEQISVLDNELKEILYKISDFLDLKDKITDNLKLSNADKNKIIELHNSLAKDIDMLSKNVDNLKSQIKDLNTKLGIKQKEKDDKLKEEKILKDKLLLLQQEMNKLNGDIQIIFKNISSMKKPQEQGDKYLILISQIIKISQDMVGAIAIKDDIEKQLNISRNLKDELIKEYEQLKKQHQSNQTYQKEIQDEINVLKKNISDLKNLPVSKVSADLKKMRDDLLLQLKNLEQQKIVLEKENGDKGQELENIKKRLIDINNNMDKIKKDIEAKNNLLGPEKDRLKNQELEYKKKVDELNNLDNMINQLKGVLPDQLNKKIDEINNKLDKSVKDLIAEIVKKHKIQLQQKEDEKNKLMNDMNKLNSRIGELSKNDKYQSDIIKELQKQKDLYQNEIEKLNRMLKDCNKNVIQETKIVAGMEKTQLQNLKKKIDDFYKERNDLAKCKFNLELLQDISIYDNDKNLQNFVNRVSGSKYKPWLEWNAKDLENNKNNCNEAKELTELYRDKSYFNMLQKEGYFTGVDFDKWADKKALRKDINDARCSKIKNNFDKTKLVSKQIPGLSDCDSKSRQLFEEDFKDVMKEYIPLRDKSLSRIRNLNNIKDIQSLEKELNKKVNSELIERISKIIYMFNGLKQKTRNSDDKNEINNLIFEVFSIIENGNVEDEMIEKFLDYLETVISELYSDIFATIENYLSNIITQQEKENIQTAKEMYNRSKDMYGYYAFLKNFITEIKFNELFNIIVKKKNDEILEQELEILEFLEKIKDYYNANDFKKIKSQISTKFDEVCKNDLNELYKNKDDIKFKPFIEKHKITSPTSSIEFSKNKSKCKEARGLRLSNKK